MLPKDFVFNQIYKGAISQGSSERNAKEMAARGVSQFLKGQFSGKPSGLIMDMIATAVKLSKMELKKSSKK